MFAHIAVMEWWHFVFRRYSIDFFACPICPICPFGSDHMDLISMGGRHPSDTVQLKKISKHLYPIGLENIARGRFWTLDNRHICDESCRFAVSWSTKVDVP